MNYSLQISLATINSAEVDAFRAEVARRMRIPPWNNSVPAGVKVRVTTTI